MLSRCKHIFHFLLVAMVMGFASCTSWEEAEGIVAEADRLLGEGVIMRDTLALAEVVDACDSERKTGESILSDGAEYG